jgi:hypothetical protein
MQKVTCPSCSADASDEHIIIHPGLNAEGHGFVHMAHGRELRAQFTPQEARDHALRLLEIAEAAESDAIVYRMLIDKVGLDRVRAVNVIADLRNFRDDVYRKKGGNP